MIRIVPVPRDMLCQMWPHVLPFLMKANTSARLEEIVADIDVGTDALWMIFDDDKPVAAFLTCLALDESGTPYLAIHSLGGKGVKRWNDAVDETMQPEARRAGVDRIRFCGRAAWSRVHPTLRVVGTYAGETVYERIVAS